MDLLSHIEAFIATHEMKDSQFGILALNDKNLIGESSAAVGADAVYIGDLAGVFHAVNRADGKGLGQHPSLDLP